MKTFFKSSILRFGPIITPYNITISDSYVEYFKNNGFKDLFLTWTKISLKISEITNIVINYNILWCNIDLITSSGEYITVKHFSQADAENIKNLIHK
jgi:hypothetical protein